MSEENSTLSADDVFAKWLNNVSKEGSIAKYQAKSRIPLIEDLADLLILHKISYGDAKFLKRRVIGILVSEKGISRKEKHSNGNWLKNTEADFDMVMADNYIPDIKHEDYRISNEFSEDPKIVEWCKNKFGKHVGMVVIKSAHDLNSMLNIKYLNETVDKRICYGKIRSVL